MMINMLINSIITLTVFIVQCTVFSDHLEPTLDFLCYHKPEMSYHSFPHEHHKFYVCIDQETYVMDCPYNLYYNPRRNLCAIKEEESDYSTEELHPNLPRYTTKKPIVTHHTTKHHTTSHSKSKTTHRPVARKTTPHRTRTNKKHRSEENLSDIIATGVLPQFLETASESREFENLEIQEDYDNDYNEKSQVECCEFYSNVCWDC